MTMPDRVLYFDFATGASGDKIMGALLEACESLKLVTLDDLQRVASALVSGVSVTRNKIIRGGILASSIKISEAAAVPRNWADIRSMIQATAVAGVLTPSACDLALRVFESVAQAEALVHDEPVDQVHFHEIGAADSIVDIVGSCYLLDLLAPVAVFASPLVLGFGTFRASHGLMSVPAPATTRLIQGLNVVAGPHEGEMTTPTGAALAAAFVTDWQPYYAMRPIAYGYGAGTRTVKGASNTVFLLVGERAMIPDATIMNTEANAENGNTETYSTITTDASTTTAPSSKKPNFILESVTLLEANIDHRSPEAIAFAAEELLAAGALDVWQEPITMKKGRLAVKLVVLCPIQKSTEFFDRTLALTGSLGLRLRYVERVVLPRAQLELDTPWGKVRFKSGRYVGEFTELAGSTRWLRPEHDDVARLARELDRSYDELYEQLCTLADRQLIE